MISQAYRTLSTQLSLKKCAFTTIYRPKYSQNTDKQEASNSAAVVENADRTVPLITRKSYTNRSIKVGLAALAS